MGKRDLILDTMEELLAEQKGASCSVSDIAKKAGIAKGGLYYYFKSKEEVFDALVERTYQKKIDGCERITLENGKNAIEKLGLVFQYYRSSFVSSQLDTYLHKPQNAEIHQKSLAKILTGLSPVIGRIIEQGIEEGLFQCEYPMELSETILSAFCFLLDPGIFYWSPEQMKRKLIFLASLVERELGAAEGSMDFFVN